LALELVQTQWRREKFPALMLLENGTRLSSPYHSLYTINDENCFQFKPFTFKYAAFNKPIHSVS